MKLSANKRSKGFIALTAVMVISFGCLAYLIAIETSALEYRDQVMRRELRMQKQLNVRACKDSMDLMLKRSYLMTKPISIPEFGC